MPRGEKTKEPAFKMWQEGKSLAEIQQTICGSSRTKPSSVARWVKDWERRRQRTWTPRIDNSN